MAELKEKPTVYYIPENFVEEGRIFQGTIKVKNLVQGALLALPLALIGWGIGKTLQVRITLSIILAGPMLFFGVVGFNDDPLFTVIKNFMAWRKERCVRLYNPEATPFYVSPTETIFSTDPKLDVILKDREERKKRKVEAHLAQEYVQGENFDFANDPTVKKFHDESQRPPEGFVPRHVVSGNADFAALFGAPGADLGGFAKREKAVDFGADDEIV